MVSSEPRALGRKARQARHEKEIQEFKGCLMMNNPMPCRITDEKLPQWKPSRDEILDTLKFDRVHSFIQDKWIHDLGNLRINAVEILCDLQKSACYKAEAFKKAEGSLREALGNDHDEAEKRLEKATVSLSEAMEGTPTEEREVEVLARFIWEFDQDFFEDEIEEYILSVSRYE